MLFEQQENQDGMLKLRLVLFSVKCASAVSFVTAILNPSMADTQRSSTSQELEEMAQSIEDEIYSTKTFNSNLKQEIAQLENELESLCRCYYKKKTKNN